MKTLVMYDTHIAGGRRGGEGRGMSENHERPK